MSEKITAIWQRTIYQGDNGYIICRYLNKDSEEEFAAAGYYLPAERGCSVRLNGDWKYNQRGQTFQVEGYDLILPTSKDDTIAYLQSLRCGIGKKTAEKLYNRFGNSLWDVIENNPEQIKNKKLGTSRVNIDRLVKGYNDTVQVRELVQMFSSIEEVGVRQITSIMSKLQNDTVGRLKRNPYVLCSIGFSFSVADTLAVQQSFDRSRPERTSAAIISTLSNAESEGHMYLPIALLCSRTRRKSSHS